VQHESCRISGQVQKTAFSDDRRQAFGALRILDGQPQHCRQAGRGVPRPMRLQAAPSPLVNGCQKVRLSGELDQHVVGRDQHPTTGGSDFTNTGKRNR
jgi:hypothetical protein